MTKENSERLSDLQLARALSRQLSDQGRQDGDGPEERHERESHYARLVGFSERVETSVPEELSQELASQPTEPAEEISSWNELLAWCQRATNADCVVAVDAQGFVIESRGKIPPEGFDAVGAELSHKIDQLERSDHDCGKVVWMEMELNRRRIFATKSVVDDDEFVIGHISHKILSEEQRQVICSTTSRLIESLI